MPESQGLRILRATADFAATETEWLEIDECLRMSKQ